MSNNLRAPLQFRTFPVSMSFFLLIRIYFAFFIKKRTKCKKPDRNHDGKNVISFKEKNPAHPNPPPAPQENPSSSPAESVACVSQLAAAAQRKREHKRSSAELLSPVIDQTDASIGCSAAAKFKWGLKERKEKCRACVRGACTCVCVCVFLPPW